MKVEVREQTGVRMDELKSGDVFARLEDPPRTLYIKCGGQNPTHTNCVSLIAGKKCRLDVDMEVIHFPEAKLVSGKRA